MDVFMNRRQCTKCEEWFPQTHFVPNKGWCTQCRKDYMREWRKSPGGKMVKAAHRRQYDQRPDRKAKLKQYNRDYYLRRTVGKRKAKKEAEGDS